MKTLTKQDSNGLFNNDIYRLAIEGLKHHFGYARLIESNDDGELFELPSQKIFVSRDKKILPDLEIRVTTEFETVSLYAKYIF